MADLPTQTAGHQLRDIDFHAWTQHQAAALRERRLEVLDAEHVAGEIEALAQAVATELRSRFAVLFQHLLKWQYQGGLRGRAWESAVAEQRHALRGLFEKNPSLERVRERATFDGYQDALVRVELETGYPRDVFPSSSPFTFEQAIDDAFWPDLT
jgi:hypothetical protein